MRALVLFSDNNDHPLSGLLKPGFRHVSIVAHAAPYWVLVDPAMRGFEVKVMADASVDLAALYRDSGVTVVDADIAPALAVWPLALANCVGAVKVMLGINAPWIVTPHQLYKHLTKRTAA